MDHGGQDVFQHLVVEALFGHIVQGAFDNIQGFLFDPGKIVLQLGVDDFNVRDFFFKEFQHLRQVALHAAVVHAVHHQRHVGGRHFPGPVHQNLHPFYGVLRVKACFLIGPADGEVEVGVRAFRFQLGGNDFTSVGRTPAEGVFLVVPDAPVQGGGMDIKAVQNLGELAVVAENIGDIAVFHGGCAVILADFVAHPQVLNQGLAAD